MTQPTPNATREAVELPPCPLCGADVTEETGFADNFGSGPYLYASCSNCTYQADTPDHRRLRSPTSSEERCKALEEFRYFDGPMWGWFGLSYAGYLVVPRAVACEMPIEWQVRMVSLLNEMNDHLDWDGANNYVVQMRGPNGKFATDPLANYKYPPKDAVRIRALADDGRAG